MNEFVACLLDGEYWNSIGPRRKPSVRFTYDDFKISISRTRRPSQPMTEEQKQRAREAAERRRQSEAVRRAAEERRQLERLQREEEGVLLFDERIVLGGEVVARNAELLERLRVRGILNVTERVPNYHEHSPQFVYKRIYVLDTNEQEIRSRFGEAASFIAAHAVDGQRVLVHCKQGRSRSPSFVLAYAMHSLGLTLAQAWRELTSRVPEEHLNINCNFQRQLMHYERDLFHVNSHDFFQRERKVVQPFSITPTRVIKGTRKRRRSQRTAIEIDEVDSDDEVDEEEDEGKEEEERQMQSVVDVGADAGEELSAQHTSVNNEEEDVIVVSQHETAVETQQRIDMDAMDVELAEPTRPTLRLEERGETRSEAMEAKTETEAQRATKRRRGADDTDAAVALSTLLARLEAAHATTAAALERAHRAELQVLEEQKARLQLERRILELEEQLRVREGGLAMPGS